MKVVKGISIFFLCIALLGLGFFLGVKTMNFFYPGDQGKENINTEQESDRKNSNELTAPVSEVLDAETIAYGEARAVASVKETLCVDTEYVVMEMDVLNDTMEQSTFQLPAKYIGMDREQFIEAMDIYESNPPLEELERGFVHLEVLSFSREKVVVQMNYKFVQPSASFYLAAFDGRVVVYLEDKSTMYIQTDIMLDTLPDEMQKDIIGMMFISNEEELYDFLEGFSS